MIRRLTVDDMEAFRELREEAMRLYPESFGSPEEEQGGERQEAAYRDILQKDEIWGAFENGNLVGAAGFHVSPDKQSQNFGQMFIVHVHKAHQGKGFGNKLVKAILAEAETRVDQVHLCVVHTANAAISVFLKNGFEICGTEKSAYFVGDTALDEHLMIKKFR